MAQLTAEKTIERYRKQSVRLLGDSFGHMRNGRWNQSEELLWGSLTLAVKAVALSKGTALSGDETIKEYAYQLGKDRRDRRIREAFKQLSAFSDLVDQVRDAKSRVDYLFVTLDDVSEAVEHLWQMVDSEEDNDPFTLIHRG